MTADEFARRVEALKPVMYRVCRAQLSEPHDREDAVQEAILRAWEKQDGLREPKFFETWFIRILINACHDIQRRNRRTVAMDAPPEREPAALHGGLWRPGGRADAGHRGERRKGAAAARAQQTQGTAVGGGVQMMRREDFIDALGMPDEGFTNAVDAALRQVKEGEARPVMKRKMTLTLLAAVLAVIALAGAALAVGLNLFDHFGRNDRRLQVVAPEAALMVNDAVEVTTDALGVSRARIDSAYYDGQSLIVAYTLDNYQRYEPFEPTGAELAEMTENRDYLLEAFGIEGDPAATEALRDAIDRKQPPPKPFGTPSTGSSPMAWWITQSPSATAARPPGA